MNNVNYSIAIEVKDKDGNLIIDQDGNPQVSISFDTYDVTDTQIRSILKSHFQTLKTWMPDRKIVVKAYVFSLSRTHPLIFLYSEEGFQVH